MSTVKPLKRGHFGTVAFVLYSEVAPFLFLNHILVIYIVRLLQDVFACVYCNDLYKQVLQINKWTIIMYV